MFIKLRLQIAWKILRNHYKILRNMVLENRLRVRIAWFNWKHRKGFIMTIDKNLDVKVTIKQKGLRPK